MRLRLAALTAAVGLFVFVSPASAGESLRAAVAHGTTKIFVAPPTDSTAAKKVDPTVLKKSIEQALAARKDPKFEIAPSRDAADLAVSADVVEYVWSDHDPVDMIVGVGGAAYDALTDEHYARLQANVRVEDQRGRALWSDKLVATVTDAKMAQDDGPGRVSERFGKVFVREAFGRRRR